MSTMEVKEVLFMKKGEGESSYAQASAYTQKVTARTKPILEKALESLFSKDFHLHKLLNVADLGCSVGPNTFRVLATIKESVEKKSRELNCQTPEIQVYLNDLPGNDFNALFKGLSRFFDQNGGLSCFVNATSGSFHGRLFPRNSLHFIHSSYSAHWLSQVPKGLTSKEGLPLNKGKMYISKTSPPAVREAYLAQFQEDFTLFLRCRSEEMLPNGRIILILHGRRSRDPSDKESCYTWELLATAIKEMVLKGLIDEEKLDSFNVPYYIPSAEEVQDIVEREGSFAIEYIETFAVDAGNKELKDVWDRGEKVAKNMRSFTEPIIAYQFGEENMEELFQEVTHLVVADLAKDSREGISIAVVLSSNIG